jgi:hypothetical protein
MIKLLEIMEKGKKRIARCEYTEGERSCIVGIELTEDMTESAFMSKADAEGQRKLSSPPPVRILPVEVEEIISEAETKIQRLSETLKEKLGREL